MRDDILTMYKKYPESKTRAGFELIGKYGFMAIGFCFYAIVMFYVWLFELILDKMNDKKTKKTKEEK